MENPFIRIQRNVRDATRKMEQLKKKEHEQNQKQIDKFRYFHHLKDNSYKEISDVLDEVLGFIQRYKLFKKNLKILLKFILKKKFTTSVLS